ncbi:MAG: LLM class F420-dependent oxidoreductase [Rubrobacter sp.]|nr:LLM class F420-dependent oxidoreductase [Rubrobacteraceae bacterium]MDQ3437797.1 LLM class F420-dependent oxidoreductase [Actinomycetota bacterium]
MKLDAALGTEGKYLKEVDRSARAAEDLGFAGLWTSETKHDAFLPLAIAANETREIELGTSVAIAFSRSPMETAQTAWDLQDLSDGRFVLGLGTQVKAHITRRFSMPWDRPAARLHEYILALRAIWESFQTEEPLQFEGDFYRHTLMTPFFDPGPIDHPEIPVYIAGVNTRLARLAGEVCDGFHVHPFHSPEYVRQTVEPAVAEGAEGAGRDPEEVTLATSAFVIAAENEEKATEQRESIRSQISFYASTPTYRTVLEAHGWEEVGEKLGTMAREKKWREMPALITDEMVAAFATEATPDEIGPALRERYEGLIDRVALYLPFVPGERDEFWRTMITATH